MNWQDASHAEKDAVIQRIIELRSATPPVPTKIIAERLGLSKNQVAGLMHRYGAPKGENPAKVVKVPDEVREAIIRLRKADMPIYQIMAQHNLSEHVVKKVCIRAKLPTGRAAPPVRVRRPGRVNKDSMREPPKLEVISGPAFTAPASPLAQESAPPRPAKATRRMGYLLDEPCCWPLGEPGKPGFRMCDVPSEPGKPYCAAHCRVAYKRTDIAA